MANFFLFLRFIFYFLFFIFYFLFLYFYYSYFFFEGDGPFSMIARASGFYLNPTHTEGKKNARLFSGTPFFSGAFRFSFLAVFGACDFSGH